VGQETERKRGRGKEWEREGRWGVCPHWDPTQCTLGTPQVSPQPAATGAGARGRTSPTVGRGTRDRVGSGGFTESAAEKGSAGNSKLEDSSTGNARGSQPRGPLGVPGARGGPTVPQCGFEGWREEMLTGGDGAARPGRPGRSRAGAGAVALPRGPGPGGHLPRSAWPGLFLRLPVHPGGGTTAAPQQWPHRPPRPCTHGDQGEDERYCRSSTALKNS